MIANTLKAKRRLVSEFHFSDEHAEGIVEVLSSAEEHIATKEDIRILKSDVEKVWVKIDKIRIEMGKLKSDLTVRMYGAIATATAILLAAEYL